MAADKLPKLTRAEMEQTARQLVGRRLGGVTYYELESKGVSRPSWSDPQCDALDFGLDLCTTDGQTFGIVWDWDFCHYGLSLRPTSVRGRLLACAEWDVTSASRWADLCGSDIVAASLSWEDDADADGQCPQRLDLRFANGRRVQVRSAEFVDGSAWKAFADHVVVVFDGGG